MAGNLSIGEIVEMGIQIEINGRDFYKGVASKEKNKKARDIFEYLAGEEEKHLAIFNSMLQEFHRYEPKEAYPQEYFSYINSLASEVIFTKEKKGSEIAEKIKDGKEAIDLGIEFEKDSVKFYEGMKEGVPDQEKSVIERLIAEEKKHIEKLTELKEKF